MTPSRSSTRIVVLDGAALSQPTDAAPLSWAQLEQLGEVTVHDRTPPAKLLERAADAEVLVINKVPLTAEILALLPRLKLIAVTATGFNIVDIEAARHRGICVANVPEYSTDSVAQFTFALLLELCHRIGMHDQAVKEGRWSAAADFCFFASPQLELAGKTLGLVGLGRIGRRVAVLGRAFGMEVIGTSSKPSGAPPEVRWMELESLLASADVVSLHCPLTALTSGLINAKRLSLMRQSTLLLNTSRGGLVVESDLAHALQEGQIAGAAVDVASVEPIAADNPLLFAPRCLITPHIAWATSAARERLMRTTVENVAAFLAGTPKNVVN